MTSFGDDGARNPNLKLQEHRRLLLSRGCMLKRLRQEEGPRLINCNLNPIVIGRRRRGVS